MADIARAREDFRDQYAHAYARGTFSDSKKHKTKNGKTGCR